MNKHKHTHTYLRIRGTIHGVLVPRNVLFVIDGSLKFEQYKPTKSIQLYFWTSHLPDFKRKT